MDVTGKAAELHMRTDANNLVTTAQTTRQPEQKETIHMINQLRHEACSGAIDDLAHVISGNMMADCLTKNSVKPDVLVKAIRTGVLPEVDKHRPFREIMKHRHKAFYTWDETFGLAEWCWRNLSKPLDIETFFGLSVRQSIHHIHANPQWVEGTHNEGETEED